MHEITRCNATAAKFNMPPVLFMPILPIFEHKVGIVPRHYFNYDEKKMANK